MGEHTSLLDRLSWVRGQIGEGSPHQLEEAKRFIASLSESGYSEWLSIVCQVQATGLFSAPELTEYEERLWLSLPQRTRDVLALAADVITNRRLTGKQRALLTELQREEPSSQARWWAEAGRWDRVARLMGCTEDEARAAFPGEARACRDTELTIELQNARALDECEPREKPEPAGTEDRRRWPRTQLT